MNKYIAAAYLALAVFLIGCGGGGARSNQSYEMGYGGTASAPMAAPAAAPPASETLDISFGSNVGRTGFDSVMLESRTEQQTAGGTQSQSTEQRQRQRIIIDSNLNMATERFDEVSERIRGIAIENGGYVQNSNQYVSAYRNGKDIRRLNITIRVPYESYEYVFAQIKVLGVVSSANENQQNVTAEYYDIQARLQTKLIEEERILALIDKTESVEDILQLEGLLGNVRTDIEVFQTQMTNIDRLASYSTIHIYLDEVDDEIAIIVPTNLPERIQASFIQSVNGTIGFLQGVLVLLAAISVPAFVLLTAAVIIWGLFRLRSRRSK